MHIFPAMTRAILAWPCINKINQLIKEFKLNHGISCGLFECNHEMLIISLLPWNKMT